jgi:hypothetical protein
MSSQIINRFKIDHRQAWPAYAYFKLRETLVRALDGLVPALRHPVRPVFVIGCGHTGTTLLTARLGNHPAITVIPKETSWFIPTRLLWLSRQYFRRELDRCAQQGKSLLVEKTPKHVHCVERIGKLMPDARFIFMTRNPLDTVASLKKRFGSFEFALDRWLIDNAPAVALKPSPAVMFVRYEDFVTDPHAQAERIAAFLQIPVHEAVAEGGATAYDAQAFAKHPNMRLRQQQVKYSIKARVNTYAEVLDESEISEVRTRCACLMAELGY